MEKREDVTTSSRCSWKLCMIISAVIGVAVGVTVGILYHLLLNGEESTVMMYGRMQLYEIKGRNIPLKEFEKEKKLYESEIMQVFEEALGFVASFSVSEISEDQLVYLVGRDDHSAYIEFKIQIFDKGRGLTAQGIKDLLLLHLQNTPGIKINLDTFELKSKPIIKARNYESFEDFLNSENGGFDLLNVQLPGVIAPKSNNSDIVCDHLQPLQNGVIYPLGCMHVNYSTFLSMCSFSCHSNYSLIGSDSITCLSTGSWSSRPPICKARCEVLENLKGVHVTPASCLTNPVLESTKCHFYCSPGYVLQGHRAVKCLDSGKWSGIVPVCEKTCSSLGIPENGRIWPSSCVTSLLQPARTQCSFACDESYVLVGSPTLFCDVDGSWNFPLPVCRKGCFPLSPLANGIIFPSLCTTSTHAAGQYSLIIEGVVCVSKCYEGFVLDGSSERLCDTDGTWSGKEPSCFNQCPPLKLPALMSVVPSLCADDSMKVIQGQKCTLVCNDEYLIENREVLECLGHGSWDYQPGQCIQTCPKLSRPQNGMFLSEACYNRTAENSVCIVHCSSGFEIIGLQEVRCLSAGHWSGVPGKCLKKCPVLLPPSNGYVQPFNCSLQSFHEGVSCYIFCDADYTLLGESHRTCLSDGTWSGKRATCVFEKQFMIRQTTHNYDVCLTVNLLTSYVEKQPITSCSLHNYYDKWTILKYGYIQNVGSRKCLTVQNVFHGAFLHIDECSHKAFYQVWKWEIDDNFINLLGTAFNVDYGYASVSKVILSEKCKLPWHALTLDGSQTLYDLFAEPSCYAFYPLVFGEITPAECSTNTTLKNQTECSFSCNPGRKLIGANGAICNGKKWNATKPICEVACPLLTAPANGFVTNSCMIVEQLSGSICQYTCESKYFLFGEDTTTCLPAGVWTFTQPKCLLQCVPITSVANGRLVPKRCSERQSSVGTRCELICTTPYLPKTPVIIDCVGNGTWTTKNLSCERACLNVAVPNGDGGNVTCDSDPVWQGTKCQYSCGKKPQRALAMRNMTTGNLVLLTAAGSGNFISRTCQPDGSFNGTLPMCISVCAPLLAPQNGSIYPKECTSKVSPEGTYCSVKCNTSFGLRGPNHTYCKSDGFWSATGFVCAEERQFHIINKDVSPSVCLTFYKSNQSGSHLVVWKEDISTCLLSLNGVWTWHLNYHIKHVYSGLCLTVSGNPNERLTPLLVESCVATKTNQQWKCGTGTNSKHFRLVKEPWFVSVGDSEFLYGTAHYLGSGKSIGVRGFWLTVDNVNHTHIAPLCTMHTHRCSGLVVSNTQTYITEGCGNALVDISTTCIVKCKEGFGFQGTKMPTEVSVTCNKQGQWHFNTPAYEFECIKICQPIPTNINVVVTPASCKSDLAFLGDKCTFDCLVTSLHVKGSAVSVCGSSGEWSDPSPQCLSVCVHAIPTTHAKSNQTIYAKSINCHLLTKLFAGQVCFYSCPMPYLSSGSLQRTCLANGTFDLPLHECSIPPVATTYNSALCPPAPAHPQSVGFWVKSELCLMPDKTQRLCARYECQTNYKFDFLNYVHCVAESYTWQTPPLCKRSCPNIHSNCQDMVEGDVCKFTCPPNHSFSNGNGEIICQADGTWSDFSPHCVYAVHFQIQTDIKINSTTDTFCLALPFQSLELLSCKSLPTYDVSSIWAWEGPSSIRHIATGMCLSTDSLSHGARVKPKICNTLDKLQQWKCSSNARYPYLLTLQSAQDYLLGASVFVTGILSDGMRLYLGQDQNFIESGLTMGINWNIRTSVPKSIKNTLCSVRKSLMHCPSLISSLPSGGLMSPTSCVDQWSAIGQECMFQCADGYVMLNGTVKNSICLNEGVWSSLNFSCQISCPALFAPDSGYIMCSEAPFIKGSVCSFFCVGGYELSGSQNRTCQWDGYWSGFKASCIKRCPSLTLGSQVLVSPLICSMDISHLPGTICLFECNEGYHMKIGDTDTFTKKSSLSRSCNRNGTWSGFELQCTRVCPALHNPLNGKVTPVTCTSGAVAFGSICKIMCNLGFSVATNDTVVCADNGMWENSFNSVLKVCVPHCRPPAPVLNAKLECDIPVKNEHYLEGQKCSVECNVGYGLSENVQRTRVCQSNHEWSGHFADCVKENQFLIFINRNMEVSKASHVCVTSDDKGKILKVEEQKCHADIAVQRWTWKNINKIKNAGTGKCLNAASKNPGEKLTSGSCSSTSKSWNKWSCGLNDDKTPWILNFLESQLFPDVGFTTTDYFWMSNAKTSYDLHKIKMYARKVGVVEEQMATICSYQSMEGKCTHVLQPANGNVFPESCIDVTASLVVGTKCRVSCDVGYQVDGDVSVIFCQSNGLWSYPVPQCVSICDSFEEFKHGRISPQQCVSQSDFPTGVVVGDECTFECDSGWKLHGREVLSCLEIGEWSAAPPQCLKTCPKLYALENTISVDECFSKENIEGHTCVITCLPGYVVLEKDCLTGTNLSMYDDEKCRKRNENTYRNDFHLVCDANGQWLGLTECIPLCEMLQPPKNGYVFPESCGETQQVNGTICTYSCENKFIIDGEQSFTCYHGNWITLKSLIKKSDGSHATSTCVPYCGPLNVTTQNHSSIDPLTCIEGRNSVGTNCNINCQTDYVLKGDAEVTCMPDGHYNGELGFCLRKCPAVKAPPNGNVIPIVCKSASMVEGALCSFVCSEKYSLIGLSITSCSVNGTWSSPTPVCKRRCPPLGQFYYGSASPVLSCFSYFITVGNTCNFLCDESFTMHGSSSIMCLPSGEWDAPAPTCHKFCSTPFIEHGIITCNINGNETNIDSAFNGALTWGTHCEAKCDTKFMSSPTSSFLCGNVGQWVPEVPQCIEIGVPMYILQQLGSNSVCVFENVDKRAVQYMEQTTCIQEQSFTSTAAWHWFGDLNIQNGRSGRCISVLSASEGEILRTVPCDSEEPLQHWDCSVKNPFQVILHGTDLSPTTFYSSIHDVVLQHWSDFHSYFSTFDLVTLTFSSICSRRPGGVCPPLQDFGGLQVEPPLCKSNKIEAGQQCSYECENFLIGSPYTVCMGNGIWSSPPPECLVICDPLEDISNNSYYLDADCIFDPSSVGKVCEAQCKAGYDINGDGNRTCLPTGYWSANNLQCLVTCPTIFGLINGYIHPTPCRSGFCIFKCRPGYVLAEDEIFAIECVNGEWNGVVPKCIRDVQFQIMLLGGHNVYEMCLSVTEDDSKPLVKLPCQHVETDNGHQLFRWKIATNHIQHPLSGKCLKGNSTKWSPLLLHECSDVDSMQYWECGSNPTDFLYSLRIKDSSVFLDSGIRTDKLLLSSNTDMFHEVVMETQYYQTSKWLARHHFGEGTVCSMREFNQCPPFTLTSPGVVQPEECQNHTQKGMECIVSCEEGYSSDDSDRSVCASDGLWIQPLPVCIGKYQCTGFESLDTFLNVEPLACQGRQISEGKTCRFLCDSGYQLVGKEILVCIKDGMWSGPLPYCKQVCEPLSPISNGTVQPFSCHGSNNAEGSVCKVKCGKSLKLVGSAIRSCKGGVWSGTNSRCLSYCDVVVVPASGNVFPDRCKGGPNFEMNACNFRCNPGFLLLGTNKIVCTNGNWSDAFPTCVPKYLCPQVTQANVGVQSVFYKNLIADVAIGTGTEIFVLCNEHFYQEKETTRVCLADGKWQFGTPHCNAHCHPLSYPNNGEVMPEDCAVKYQKAGTTCMANCKIGWKQTGSTTLTCNENGKWSNPLPICSDGPTTVSVSTIPFVVKQYHPIFEVYFCLKADTEGKMVHLSIQCPNNSTSSSSHFQWMWRNIDMLESVQFPNRCWAPLYNGTKIILSLAPCDSQVVLQHFKCGDAKLMQFFLNIGTENLWLANDVDSATNVVYLVSSTEYYAVDWQAFTTVTNKQLQNGKSVCNQICGGALKGKNGNLVSPGYPVHYPGNLNCQWKINVPQHLIRIWVTDMDIETVIIGDDDVCYQSYLHILEGTSFEEENSNTLAKLCGHSTSFGPITALNGVVLLEFKTGNKFANHRGFKIYWMSEAYPEKDCDSAIFDASLPVASPVSRLFGGAPQQAANVPWFATVFGDDDRFHDNQQMCGAAFIHTRFLISAAQCVQHTAKSGSGMAIVGYGTSDLWRLEKLVERIRQKRDLEVAAENGSVAVRVSKVFIHPDFDENFSNDIALLLVAETKNDLRASSHMSPLCLPPLTGIPTVAALQSMLTSSRIYLPKHYCKLAGWGSASVGHAIISKLSMVELPVLSDVHCTRVSAQSFGVRIDSVSTLCAGHFDSTRQTVCQGDVGSVLTCDWNGRYYAVGVVTQQIASCSSLNKPRFFTRIDSNMKWIRGTIMTAHMGAGV